MSRKPQDFLSRRGDLSVTDLADSAPLQAGPGEVVLDIERFALTANNITYGVAGDIIGYWQFFPATGDWGRIPVWGIGTVSQSEHPDVAAGTRFYGYFPMSSELKVKPEKVNERGFIDGAAHRAELPPVYNQYSLVSEATGFAPGFDNHAMLYRPLFTTSFVLDDYFAVNDFFGAQQIIVGSASSKTGFGLAFLLQKREGVDVIGLTSAANRDFVERLGLYDQVLTYDEVDAIDRVPSAYVDMSGNRNVLEQIHHHLDAHMLNSCGVGATHWTARDGADPKTLPGAKPTMFFAPSHIMARQKELGAAAYQGQIAAATAGFFDRVDAWVTIEEAPFSDIDRVYRTVLNGAPPDHGYVVTGELSTT